MGAGEEQGDDHRRPEQRQKTEGGNLAPPWKPGQSGNPRGRPRGRTFGDALREATEDPAVLDEIVGRLLDIIRSGEAKDTIAAIREFSNRRDGRPHAAVEVTHRNEEMRTIHLVDDEEDEANEQPAPKED